MSYGSSAYNTFVRIHVESGERPPEPWTELSHVDRLAWEAAAQEVARAVIPEFFNEDPLDELDDSFASFEVEDESEFAPTEIQPDQSTR